MEQLNVSLKSCFGKVHARSWSPGALIIPYTYEYKLSYKVLTILFKWVSILLQIAIETIQYIVYLQPVPT